MSLILNVDLSDERVVLVKLFNGQMAILLSYKMKKKVTLIEMIRILGFYDKLSRNGPFR